MEHVSSCQKRLAVRTQLDVVTVNESVAAENLLCVRIPYDELLVWRFHRIELDIIAETEVYLVVVEVKTRRNDTFCHPSSAVNHSKIKHIVNATQAYVFKHNIHKDIRFDIISIIPTLDGKFEIEHQEDAFLPPIGR